MEEKIIEIIKNVIQDSEIKIDKDIDLIEEDIIDSLAFIELITELEDTFNIEIYPSQVPSHVWRNVESIAKMVEEKMGE